MLSQGSTLIVDDKEEDGLAISHYLSSMCIPHLFFHADEDKILKLTQSETSFNGNFRIVFQDLNLTGGTVPSTRDYEAALAIIDKILPDTNGPWLLVVWSTYNNDEAPFANELFAHLQAELKPNKTPYKCIALDKTPFTRDQNHGTVLSESEMPPSQKSDLHKALAEASSATAPMSVLMNWEKTLLEAASNTVAELHSICSENSDYDNQLGKLLLDLAEAAAGGTLSNHNSWSSLVRLLNSQLLDQVDKRSLDIGDLTEYRKVNVGAQKAWKSKVNRVLHFETTGKGKGPGAIFTYASFMAGYLSVLTEYGQFKVKRGEGVIPTNDYIVEAFLSDLTNGDNDEFKQGLAKAFEAIECVVIDVTAPCDFSQNKAGTAKFCAGIVITDEPFGTKKLNEKYKNKIKRADYFWESCKFSLDTASTPDEERGVIKTFIFNSKLIFTLPSNSSIYDRLENASVSKMREEISGDFNHWLWQQLSRPGYTCLR